MRNLPNSEASSADFEFAALGAASFYRRAIVREFSGSLKGQLIEVGAGIGQMTALLATRVGKENLVGIEPDALATAVDGCGIVCYATPVTVAATTFALLPELLPEIGAAMRAHPTLVEGPGWIDTLVMETIPGATSKCGAEGLSCVSLPDGRGLAVKVVDGADRASDPATVTALAAVLGADAIAAPLRAKGRPPITNDAGDVVGELLGVAPA